MAPLAVLVVVAHWAFSHASVIQPIFKIMIAPLEWLLHLSNHHLDNNSIVSRFFIIDDVFGFQECIC
jgi:hypothetical protein